MAVMSLQKKSLKAKTKEIKSVLFKEIQFLKNVFSVLTIPIQTKGENEENSDYEMVAGKQDNSEAELPKRARSITELEERLEKMKSQRNLNLKSKLLKKSLNSKLSKKLKKQERKNKTKIKPITGTPKPQNQTEQKVNANIAKPVFNTEGKLVFSKFDFANVGQKDRINKTEKNPKKILENLKKQDVKYRELEEKDDSAKAKEMKEKLLWKNTLQKAEGQKIKDDPTLLKKSIKKMEQKKKQSKKQWDNRISSVAQKKDERQKKRTENIAKKKKEKKSKVIKASAKRGRVVI